MARGHRRTQVSADKAAVKARRPRTEVWIAIGLATATFLVYAQVWRFGFVNFDDPDYVNTSGRGVVWAFTSVDAANWFPAGTHAGRHSRARRGGPRPF